MIFTNCCCFCHDNGIFAERVRVNVCAVEIGVCIKGLFTLCFCPLTIRRPAINRGVGGA